MALRGYWYDLVEQVLGFFDAIIGDHDFGGNKLVVLWVDVNDVMVKGLQHFLLEGKVEGHGWSVEGDGMGWILELSGCR